MKRERRGRSGNGVKCLRGVVERHKEVIALTGTWRRNTNVQGRSGTRLKAMRGSRMKIYGRGGQLWLMAGCLEGVVEDVWEEEVFVGKEAYSRGTPSLLGPASSLSRKRVNGLAFKSKGTQRGVQIKAAGPRNTFPAFRHYPISSFSLCTPYGRAPVHPQSFTFRPNTHFHGLVRRRKDGRIDRHSSYGQKLSFIQLGLPISATLLDRAP